MNGVTAFPLAWPIGRKRSVSTASHSQFDRKRSLKTCVDECLNELDLLRARSVVISTNIPLRRDGFPYAGQAQPKDVGVAVYFMLSGQQTCLSCDMWNKVEHNLWAIVKYVEATRAQLRNGVATAAQAFAGFKALPAPDTKQPWWIVLGFEARPSLADAKARHRELALKHHPDRGGDTALMGEINAAMQEAEVSQ